MRRAWIVLVLLGLAGWASAQDFIRYTPPGGLSQLTTDGTTITSTLPLILPAGSAAAPSLGFTGGTTSGPYFASGTIRFAVAGNAEFQIGNDAVTIGTSLDLTLSREAAATLQLGADAATATAQIAKGPDSTGANVAGASFTLKAGAGTSGNATGGQLILQGGANAGSGEPGAVAIADGGAKPTCAAGIRGSLWYDAGGAGVLDTLEVCRKDAANNYAWVSLF